MTRILFLFIEDIDFKIVNIFVDLCLIEKVQTSLLALLLL